jgi:Cu/Ag efflux protein CusF
MQRRNVLLTTLVLLQALAQPGPALAQAGADATPLVDAEVRKIDRAEGKITLRHGPIPNLDMPPMTMVFRVVDPALMDGLRPGDRLRFSADRIDGVYTVTAVAPPK